MKRILRGFLIVLFVFSFSACGLAANKTEESKKEKKESRMTESKKDSNITIQADENNEITATKAKEIIDTVENVIILDVRTQEEFKQSRIPNSILIPNYEIASRAEKELPDKNAIILIYCRSGNRSASATKEMRAMGYTRVYDFGGIIDWPYETIKG